jgi:TP901 family phage tail tape measure protein
VANGANFDAEIRLDIGPFIASIQRAQSEVQKLSQQIDAINKKKLTVQSGVSGGSGASTASVGTGSSARMAASREEIALQRQADTEAKTAIRERASLEKQTAAEARVIKKEVDTQNRINAKTEWQAEQMRVKSRDAALKDHQTWGRRMDDVTATEARQRTNASNSIKAQMQDRASLAQQTERNLARERYALYDVAAAYTVLAGAAGAAVSAMAGTAIEYERSFANIVRTTDFVSARIGAAAQSAKNDLKGLASEIPVAFSQITQIGTIGNQLGIAQGAITSFTETVAKFSAATGVTVDATAMAFGRIGELLNVPAQDFEKLGSAIAFAGVNAVATEEQILSVTKEIATTAKMAKFSAADVVGLSTALSSLGIAPEAARGSIIRTFAGINKVISEGGDSLNAYASIAGMTAEKFAATWQENGEEGFSALLRGLQGLSNEGKNLDTVLRDLGMVNVRDIQTIQKLGDNYSVYTEGIKDANQGFKEGTFLGQAYGVIQDTVASKLTLVSNNMANLLDTLGQTAVGDTFKEILDGVNDLLVRLNQFAKTPLGQTFGFLVVVGGTLVTVIAAINAASAIAQASLRAFATAQIALIGTTDVVSVSVGKMNGQLAATGPAGTAGALGLQKGKIALNALNTLFKAIKWLAIIGAVTVALEKLGQAFTSAEQKAENLLGGFSGVQDALTADLSAYTVALSEVGGDVEAAKRASGVIAELSTTIENNNEELNKAITSQNSLNTLVGLGANNARTLSTEFGDLNFVIGENTRLWVANAIAQSEAFQKLAENESAFQAIINAGFDLNSALEAAASGNLDAYMADINSKAIEGAGLFERMTSGVANLGDASRQAAGGSGFFADVVGVLGARLGYILSLVPRIINEFTTLFGFDLFPVSSSVDALQDTTQGLVNQLRLLGPLANQANSAFADQNAGEYADQLDEIDNSAKGAARSLRTVVDYANDLRGVFSRAFEIRFGQQESLDRIASGWNSIAERASGATEAIRKANDEIKELTADRSILEYQLTVAERYGDEQRAAVIRAKIAKIDSNVANKKEDIKEATEDLSRSTEGNTDVVIENRNVLLQQVESYAGLIEMYSKTGLRGKELRARVKELKEEFIQQGLQAGYSREQLLPYTKAFDDMNQTIKKTPRKVDVEFKSNISAAQQAINEYLAKLKQASGTFTTKIDVILPKPGSLRMIIDPSDYRLYRLGLETGKLTPKQFYKAVYGINLNNFAAGGFVSGPGTATSDSIPAMLSNGEYVVKASAVGAYGVDFLNALNQQKVGSFGSTTGAVASSSGSTVAYLSPEDRALLRAAIDRPVNLYTENAKIASSANAGNVVLAQRGTN